MQEYINVFDNVVVALIKLGREDGIHTFVYGLKPTSKDF